MTWSTYGGRKIHRGANKDLLRDFTVTYKTSSPTLGPHLGDDLYCRFKEEEGDANTVVQ